MDNVIEFLGRRLRALRHQAGWTQEQAAAAVGISFKYYQELEGGRKQGVRIVTADAIAQAYGISLAEVFSIAPLSLRVREEPALPPHRRKPRRRRAGGAAAD